MTNYDSESRQTLRESYKEGAIAHWLGQREQLPSYVYRYRSAKTGYFTDELRRAVVKSDLYFSAQPEVNDDFDLFPAFSNRVRIGEFRREIWPSILHFFAYVEKCRHADGLITTAELRNRIAWNKGASFSRVNEYYEMVTGDTIQSLTKTRSGIVSFSRSRSNMVLWALYADKGTGICLEISCDGFPTEGLGFGSVKYSDERPVFDHYGYFAALAMSMPDYCALAPPHIQKMILQGATQLRFLTTKSASWSHEEEMRLVTSGKVSRYASIIPWHVSAVYVGYNADAATMEAVQSAVVEAERHIGIYNVRLSSDSYELYFEEL